MTIKYKLTDQNLQTYKGFQWEIGKWVEAQGPEDGPLCTNSWLHCHNHPLLAVLHNPIHTNISNPKLFEVECEGATKNDYGMKCGYRRMKLVKEIALPEITTEQKVAYAILCAKTVYINSDFNKWVDDWLSEKDRSEKAARAARAAAWTAARAAAWTAARAAAWAAARAAAWAARAAAEAAWAAAEAAWAAWAAAEAAWAAAEAARAAAEAARAAAETIDLIAIAKEAMKY